ncbi:hypothetical protein C2845_PM03G28910 [Panicum miliaceum]|uniref:Uncharacterized protein n=1 Tax=Panicum miliaceum TaxID=4540 RepID=A0A3L6TD41_PANMI|nr:hypothetical protein C2845_PM03G28910 [Panicum miliaceum]
MTRIALPSYHGATSSQGHNQDGVGEETGFYTDSEGQASHEVERYMEGDTALMRYKEVKAKTPVRTPDNSPARYRIIRVKTPTGYEKQLIPPVERDELNTEESVRSTPLKIKRHSKPPTIKGPMG